MGIEKNKKSDKLGKGTKEVKPSSKKISKNKLDTLKVYRAAYEKCMKKNDALRSELQELKKKIKQYEKTFKKINNKIDLSKAVAKKVAKKKKTTTSNSTSPAPKTAKKKATNAAPAQKVPRSIKVAPNTDTKLINNLKVIEGIGPAIEKHLKSVGINSFAILGKTPARKIKEILLERGGSRYSVHDPSSWAQQAKLALAGNKAELKALQKELKVGKK
ncbi:MAG: putative flap endonuclease-1-like 5' DNA nuclease [Saprospiraceae bacterium]|jgi:predicted flap endonuclease-1-like 5' DNA nuclease